MLQRLYSLFIAPRQADEDLRNRELVLNVLLVGTIGILVAAFLVLVLKYAAYQHEYLVSRLVVLGTVLVAVWWIFFLSRSGHHRFAGWLLIFIYICLATGVAYRWGVAMPYAVGLFALVIMLTGIILGSPYPLYMAAACITIIFSLKLAEQYGHTKPDMSWVSTSLDIGVVAGFCLIFGVIALVSWLFNHQTERSLHRAHRAEAGLLRQKMLLETKVEERTHELQTAQLEKIQQMYRFAELGQLSTALMHDLANHLTTLTLDIEGLEAKENSRLVRRAKRSIRYIDEMVLRVRDQLHGKVHVRPFSVSSEMHEVLTLLNTRARAAGVRLKWEELVDKKELVCRGEPIRFRQLIANMVANAIDAYDGVTSEQSREVLITADADDRFVTITVTDRGKGIPTDVREQLFEPFYSTKKTGMGMGLYISRQIAAEQFRGGVTLHSATDRTAFIIKLAKS